MQYPEICNTIPGSLPSSISEVAINVTKSLVNTHLTHSLPYRLVYDANLQGACAIGAYFLHRQIPNSRFVYGKFQDKFHHCWVEWNHWIIDPTASQFKLRVPFISMKTTGVTQKFIPKLYDQQAVDKVSKWEQTPFNFDFTNKLELSELGRIKFAKFLPNAASGSLK